ncbi:MAG: PIN domain-containing protein [Candidatus Muiribacteriota bacterium]
MYQFIHFAMVFIGTITGFTIANYYSNSPFFMELFPQNTMLWLSLFFGSSGYLIGVFVALFINQIIKRTLSHIEPEKFIPQLTGLTAGIAFANLILIPVYIFTINIENRPLFVYLKLLIPLFFNIVFAVAGVKFAEKFKTASSVEKGIIVDSNLLIDGRIEKIAKLKLFNAKLIVPDFILEELQILADNKDEIKRKKGRKALEILEKLKKKNLVIVISDSEIQQDKTFDNKLIEIAQKYGYILFTNDFNLIKKSKVIGIKTVFLKDFEEALKPSISYGDYLTIKLIKKGRDNNQAVGYLEDGTMIVAHNAKKFIGETKQGKVENIVQTNAGKIIFIDII